MAVPLNAAFQGLDAALKPALNQINIDEIKEYGFKVPGSLFAGSLEMNKGTMHAGGIRYKTSFGAPDNTAGIGVTTGATAVLAPVSGYEYKDMVYNESHMPNLMASASLSHDVVRKIMKEGNQDGLEDVKRKVIADVVSGVREWSSIYQVLGRDAIMGTVTGITNAGGTAISSGQTPDDEAADFGTDPVSGAALTGRFKFKLQLGVDAIFPAFRVGRIISIGVVPADYMTSSHTGAAVGNIRNNLTGTNGTTCAIYVIGPTRRLQTLSGNTHVEVYCAAYYAAATKDYWWKSDGSGILNTLTTGAPGTGDVVTPFCGELAAASTTKTRGANFGRQGYLFWLSPINIATAGGATSTAIKNTDGTSISRAVSGNAHYWNMYINDVYSAGLTQLTMDHVLDVADNLSARNGDVIGETVIAVANDALIKTLAASIGGGTYRQMDNWSAKNSEKFQSYGYTGVVFQGPGIPPMVIARNNWLPPYCVAFLKSGIFSTLAYDNGYWGDIITGQVWHARHNSSGVRLLSAETTFTLAHQIDGRDLWNIGAVRYCKPA